MCCLSCLQRKHISISKQILPALRQASIKPQCRYWWKGTQDIRALWTRQFKNSPPDASGIAAKRTANSMMQCSQKQCLHACRPSVKHSTTYTPSEPSPSEASQTATEAVSFQCAIKSFESPPTQNLRLLLLISATPSVLLQGSSSCLVRLCHVLQH